MIYIFSDREKKEGQKKCELRLWLSKDVQESRYFRGYPGIHVDFPSQCETPITMVDMSGFKSDLVRVAYWVFTFVPQYVARFQDVPEVIREADHLKYFFTIKRRRLISMAKNDKLFPECLNKGSKGPAVAVLQALLLFGKFNTAIIVDGDYGGETMKGVKGLQSILEVEQTGDFDQPTKDRIKEKIGFDIDAIPASAFVQFPGKPFGVRP